MSDPRLISPLLDNFAMGGPFSEHHGICCCPAIDEKTGKRYIVKILSVPTSKVQLDALLLTGAYSSIEDALPFRLLLVYIEAVYSIVKTVVETLITLYDFSLDNIEQLAYNETGALRYGFNLGILEAGQHTIDLEYDSFPSYIYLRWKDIEGNFSTLYITTDNNTSKLPLTFNADGTSNYYIFFASTSINTLQKAKNL